MKPSRTLLSAFATFALVACTARGTGGGGIDFPDGSTGRDGSVAVGDSSSNNDASASGICATLCARVSSAAGCASAVSACMTQCGSIAAAATGPCGSQVTAFANCASTSPITCSGTTVNFTACTSQQAAAIMCLTGSSGGDGGTTTDTGGSDPCSDAADCAECTSRAQCGWCNDTCFVGTSSGPAAPNTCQGQPWAFTDSMCPM